MPVKAVVVSDWKDLVGKTIQRFEVDDETIFSERVNLYFTDGSIASICAIPDNYEHPGLLTLDENGLITAP